MTLAYVRSRNRFDPQAEVPFRLSRSKLELFKNCPRCFYLDRRLGIGPPPSFPFNLNNAVDFLLKKEFDEYRERGLPHPLMTQNRISAVPFRHDRLDHWRDALRGGIDYHHKPSGFILTGGIDDLWVNGREELIVVDYKATSKNDRISINAEWQLGYRRQIDMYAWLFRQNGFAMADVGYFVYCNALIQRPSFQARLDFDIFLLPYKWDDSWVEEALLGARDCLMASAPPGYTSDCTYCGYQEAVRGFDQQLGFDLE